MKDEAELRPMKRGFAARICTGASLRASVISEYPAARSGAILLPNESQKIPEGLTMLRVSFRYLFISNTATRIHIILYHLLTNQL